MTATATDPITVFVLSWGRPIYLWACLDALFRSTHSPKRVVLFDNAHPDPLVGDVIRGFDRRGLFAEVIRFPRNSFEIFRNAYRDRLEGIGPLHAYLESDCVVAEGPGCWLASMKATMEKNPRIGMLGSLIDTADFVPEETALSLAGGDRQKVEFLAKLNSPERQFLIDRSWAQASRDHFLTVPPCPISNPAGRLIMLRTELMREVGFQLDDKLAAAVRIRGYDTAVTPLVRHRHLSLLNIYDYADYDSAHRDAFFSPPEQGSQ
jgi:GT2 family glycosyltransferase